MASYILNDLLILKTKMATYISMKSRLFLNSKRYQFASYNELKDNLNKAFTCNNLILSIIDINYYIGNYNPDNYIVINNVTDMEVLGMAEQLTINY